MAAAAVAPPARLQAQSLDATELRIAAWVDAHVPEALDLLQQVVDVNSGTMNFDGVRHVGALFRDRFEKLGFRTAWIPGDAVGRAGHLFAERTGTRGQRLLLIGHLDTVFEKDSPFQRFERIDSSTARGPGIIDMKGGDVIIVLALQALQAAGVLDGSQIVVAFTGDEEAPGDPLEVTRRELINVAQRSDVALGFEDGDGDPATVAVNRRGFTGWVLSSTGVPAHSSQIFREDVGSGAIFEAARALSGFHDRLAGEPLLTFNPGVLLGGTTVDFDTVQSRGTAFGKTNVVAEHAVVTGDLRTISNEQRERTKSTMREIVAASLPHTSSTIAFHDSYPPMAPTSGNRAMLAKLDSISRALNTGEVRASDPQRLGAADVSFASPHVSASLDGLGLAGRDDHTVNETADLSAMSALARRAAILIYRLTR
jgi:glutamate carboxypeptidase